VTPENTASSVCARPHDIDQSVNKTEKHNYTSGKTFNDHSTYVSWKI